VRIVGLDVGQRRIGVAVSDASGTLARPLAVLEASALDATSAARVAGDIARLIGDDEDGVGMVVVGLPRRLDGTANDMTVPVQQFATRLEQAMQVRVVLQDERLTSVEAESRLAVREKDWRVRKKKLDAAAAAIILQDFLDSRR
jgi:putative Holliday junction resolvase